MSSVRPTTHLETCCKGDPMVPPDPFHPLSVARSCDLFRFLALVGACRPPYDQTCPESGSSVSVVLPEDRSSVLQQVLFGCPPCLLQIHQPFFFAVVVQERRIRLLIPFCSQVPVSSLSHRSALALLTIELSDTLFEGLFVRRSSSSMVAQGSCRTLLTEVRCKGTRAPGVHPHLAVRQQLRQSIHLLVRQTPSSYEERSSCAGDYVF